MRDLEKGYYPTRTGPWTFGGGADGYWPNGGGDFEPDVAEM